jgi:hypothetical protein
LLGHGSTLIGIFHEKEPNDRKAAGRRVRARGLQGKSARLVGPVPSPGDSWQNQTGSKSKARPVFEFNTPHNPVHPEILS